MTDVKYFKRFRMELAAPRAEPERLPAGFYWVPWADDLVDAHANVIYRSFAGQIDAGVFPNLGQPSGCGLLMRAIRDCFGFFPGATWLVAGPAGYVGSVQGLLDSVGAIQNIGVVPECRGKGLGKALVRRAVAGFAAAGAGRVYLDVTARNVPAVRLYRSLGFRVAKVVYRQVRSSHCDHAGAGI